MPNSVLYSPNSGNTKWTARSPESTKTLGKGEHAEKKAYVNYGAQYDVVLIVQDAFPCSDCDNFFITKSKTKPIAIQATEDGTGDRNYHLAVGLPNAAGYPCVIYYQGGAKSYNAAPGNWPAAPALPMP